MAKPEKPDVCSAKEMAFVYAYVVDRDGAASARTAGYAAGRARQTAYDLLQKPRIQAAIKEAQGNLAEVVGLTQAGLLAELKRHVFANFGDFIEDGMKNPSKIDAHAIASISKETGAQGGSSIKIKLKDSHAAIDRICKILGWYAPEKQELSGPGGAPIEVRDVLTDELRAAGVAALLGRRREAPAGQVPGGDSCEVVTPGGPTA